MYYNKYRHCKARSNLINDSNNYCKIASLLAMICVKNLLFFVKIDDLWFSTLENINFDDFHYNIACF